MIVSLHKSFLPLKACVGACALSLCAVLSAMPAYAQDTNASQQSEEQEQAATESTEGQAATEATEPARRERYYLGERPKLRRQEGPAIGRPKSILPQPFVPRGSIQVPPAPVIDQTEISEGDVLATADINVPGTLVEGTEQTQEIPSDDPVSIATADEQFLEAGSLELIDPSGLGLLPASESYAPDFWAGYERSAVAEAYGTYKGAVSSRALTAIAKKIASSAVTLSAPEGDADVLAIIEARLSVLASQGDTEGYIALLERLPAERDWSALVKDFTNKHLLKGELSDACAVAAAERATDDDPYWLRLAAFCEAARGNRVGVDFQLGILEEVAQIRPTFYQLIDQILVEASQAPGTIVPEAAALSNSLQVDLLEATMARLARAKVPLLALEGINPLAVRMMLSLPGVEQAAKVDLMGHAVRQGWLREESLVAFAANYQLQSGEMGAALEALDGDRRFIIDAALVHLASKAENGPMRNDALLKLWQRAVDQRTSANTSAAYVGLTKDVVPSTEAGPVAGVLTRAALMGGNRSLAAQWFTALRAEAAGTVQVDQELVGLAPLFAVVGGEGAPVLTVEQLRLWWQSEAEREDKFARANLLFTVLEALGIPVAEECWQWLEEGPSLFAGGTPSAALWRRYLIAVGHKDVPQSLALAFALLSDGGPAAVSGVLAGSLIGGLMELGLEMEARSIALEMLIGRGL